jgi:hypothetical protein
LAGACIVPPKSPGHRGEASTTEWVLKWKTETEMLDVAKLSVKQVAQELSETGTSSRLTRRDDIAAASSTTIS